MFISRKFGGAKSVVFGGLNSPMGRGLAPKPSPCPRPTFVSRTLCENNQTPRPRDVAPGELLRVLSYSRRICVTECVTTRRHPQNRKYLTYCTVDRGQPSDGLKFQLRRSGYVIVTPQSTMGYTRYARVFHSRLCCY